MKISLPFSLIIDSAQVESTQMKERICHNALILKLHLYRHLVTNSILHVILSAKLTSSNFITHDIIDRYFFPYNTCECIGNAEPFQPVGGWVGSKRGCIALVPELSFCIYSRSDWDGKLLGATTEFSWAFRRAYFLLEVSYTVYTRLCPHFSHSPMALTFAHIQSFRS